MHSNLDILDAFFDEMTADDPVVKARVLLFSAMIKALDQDPLLCFYTPAVLMTAVMGVDVKVDPSISTEYLQKAVNTIAKGSVKVMGLFLREVLKVPNNGLQQNMTTQVVDGLITASLKSAKVSY